MQGNGPIGAIIRGMEPTRRIVVPKTDAGSRLDRYLARTLDLSRGYVRRLLARGRIRLEGRPAAKGTELRAGDAIELLPFRHPSEGPRAAPHVRLDVLARAGGLVAIDKPAGLPTHPLDYEEADTALNGLLARFPELRGVGEGGLRSGVVHRLDTNTSGVLAFATEQAAWERARDAFRARRVEKRYVAVVHGCFERAVLADFRLAPRGDHMVRVSRGGLPARTRFTPLAPGRHTSLLEARPETGVMHQIRASLAALGHPVVGDARYDSPTALSRHLLHATELRLLDLHAHTAAPPEFRES